LSGAGRFPSGRSLQVLAADPEDDLVVWIRIKNGANLPGHELIALAYQSCCCLIDMIHRHKLETMRAGAVQDIEVAVLHSLSAQPVSEDVPQLLAGHLTVHELIQGSLIDLRSRNFDGKMSSTIAFQLGNYIGGKQVPMRVYLAVHLADSKNAVVAHGLGGHLHRRPSLGKARL